MVWGIYFYTLSFCNLFANESTRNLEINIWELQSQYVNKVDTTLTLLLEVGQNSCLCELPFPFTLVLEPSVQHKWPMGFKKKNWLCALCQYLIPVEVSISPNKLQLQFNQSILGQKFSILKRNTDSITCLQSKCSWQTLRLANPISMSSVTNVFLFLPNNLLGRVKGVHLCKSRRNTKMGSIWILK